MAIELDTNPDPRFPPKFRPLFHRMQGAQIIAAYVNTLLCGVALYMAGLYFANFAKKDGWAIRIVVSLLSILVIMETAFTSHQSYDTLVTKWGMLEKLDEIVPSVPAKYACVYLTAFIAQIFLASRIWIIGRSCGSPWRFMAFSVVFFSLVQTVGGLVVVGAIGTAGTFSNLAKRTITSYVGYSLGGAGAVLADISITVGLIGLFRTNFKAGSKRTVSLFRRILVLFIHRALATSVLALLGVLLYHFASGTYYFMIPLLANTHVYVISVISILTARESLRKDLDRSVHISDLVFEMDGKSNPTSDLSEFQASSRGDPVESAHSTRPDQKTQTLEEEKS